MTHVLKLDQDRISNTGSDPQSGETLGRLLNSLRQFEAGPTIQHLISVLSPNVIPDLWVGKHGVKSTSVDVGDFMNGPVGGRFVGTIHDDGSSGHRKARKLGHGYEPLFVVLGVLNACGKWTESSDFDMQASC